MGVVFGLSTNLGQKGKYECRLIKGRRRSSSQMSRKTEKRKRDRSDSRGIGFGDTKELITSSKKSSE